MQVKPTTCYRTRRREVLVCTRGGIQSWNRLVKRFSATPCDWLLVLVGDGRRGLIPAHEVGGTAVLVGGPKYSRFEIDPGRPLRLAVRG